MKLFSKIIVLALILMSAYQTGIAQNKGNKAITGQGDPVTITLDLDKITGIGLGIPATVELVQSNKQEISISGQQNILSLIDTKVKGGFWKIEFKESVNDYSPITIKVSVSDIEELSVGGSGNIMGKSAFKNLRDLQINVGGSGSVYLDAEAEKVECNLGGSGNITLKGNANEMEFNLAGSGDIDAADMKSQECEVASAGSGDIKLHCTKALEVSMAGSGDIYYKGDPKTASSTVGSGKLKKG